MSVDVLTTIAIDLARADVAEYACNPENAPLWYRNIDSAEWQPSADEPDTSGGPPARIGSRIAFVAHFLGRRLAYTYEITELVAGERLVMRTAQGPFPMETTYTFADREGGGTTMTLRNRGVPQGFSRFAAPLMMVAMRRANRQDLAAIKALLESRLDHA